MFKKQKSQSYLILPENKEKAVVLKLFYDTNIILIPNLTRHDEKKRYRPIALRTQKQKS